MVELLSVAGVVIGIVVGAGTIASWGLRRRRARLREAIAKSREILDASAAFAGAVSTAFTRAAALARARAAAVLPGKEILGLAFDFPPDIGAVTEARVAVRQLDLESLDHAADGVLEHLVSASELVGKPRRRLKPYVVCDVDGTPVSAQEAKAIIAEHWTVPEEVRSRRRSKKVGKAPRKSSWDIRSRTLEA